MEGNNLTYGKEKAQNTKYLEHEGNLEKIYHWLDSIPFLEPPKTLARDFSDGVLMAELLKMYYPQFIEPQSYVPTNNVNMKKENWKILNRRVFSRINLNLSNNTISLLANCQHGEIEKLLISLYSLLAHDGFTNSQEPMQDSEINDLEDKNTGNAPENALIMETKSLDSLGFSTVVKNWLINFFIWLFNILFFWRKFLPTQNLNGDSHDEIVCSNYPFDADIIEGAENPFMSNSMNELVTCSAYERLIQEIHEKETMITTLNCKIAYFEGAMRQKDLQIASLMSRISNSSVQILPNTRYFLPLSQVKLRPKSYNPLFMTNSYEN